jgi:tripartite-type tricarboxylate transporter receptor subunit TctC
LLLTTNTKLTHIPYKDSAPLQIGLITGEIQCGFITLPDSISHLRSAKLRAIGVTSVKRNHILPNIPTLIESGIAGHVVSQWGGILVPNKTPDHIINILYKTIVQVTASSDFILMVSDKGSDLIGNTPIEFSKFFQDETEKWGKVIEHTSIKIE